MVKQDSGFLLFWFKYVSELLQINRCNIASNCTDYNVQCIKLNT